MKTRFLTTFAILAIFVSCSSEQKDEFDAVGNLIGGSSSLNGTKWTTANWDYGIGDDWVSTMDEVYNIYFFSDTEGVFYYQRKDWYSDDGTSRYREANHFTYSVNGNKISLQYITDPMTVKVYSLTINENTISHYGFEYIKGVINSSDYSWLGTIKGTTGACRWYSNMNDGIWIVGEGKMADYSSYSQTPWAKNNRHPNDVYIEDGVTHIGAYSFANPSIAEVDMQDAEESVTEIGKFAFKGSCISSVDIPDNVKVIQKGAFGDCSYLKDINMPDNIEVIEDQAFAGCKKASLYNTPKLKYIGNHAFMSCEVTTWTGSEILEEVGDGALDNCSFKELVLPNSLKRIGEGAFWGSSISTIRIGTGLQTIEEYAFFPASKGKIYVNQNRPLSLSGNILYVDGTSQIKNWTLYVPKGSKTEYSKASYWKNFGSIVEDSNLKGD